jgi:uncharacterized protein YjbJ (UPF0337 family)
MRRNDDLDARGRDNEVEGAGEKLKGRLKDAAGSLIGDRELEAEGKADQLRGDVRKDLGEAQRKAGRILGTDR